MRIIRYSTLIAGLAGAVALPAFAADGPLVIAGARVVTVSGAVLENTSIVIQNGRRLGAADTRRPDAEATVADEE